MSKKSLPETIRSLFREDHVCPWWLAYTFDNPLRRFLHDPFAMLSSYVKEGMITADIGCGMGYFSLALARMAGRNGKVLAVDIQEKMLQKVRVRANKRGVTDIISTVLASPDNISIKGPLDFVLAFWMVHETGDIPRFLKQVSSVLKDGGKLLIAEPKLHVSRSKFEQILIHAENAGFSISHYPGIGMSRAALLVKTREQA